MIRLYAALALAAIIGLAYWHYTSLLSTIDELKLDNQALELTIETKEIIIEQKNDKIFDLKVAHEQQNVRTENLNTKLQEARSDVAQVAKVFSKINLEKEADIRPEVLQRAMNIGTIRAHRKLMEASVQ